MTDGVPGTDRREATRAFEAHRDPLIGVAYRVLGRITDAEDVALAESVSMAMLVVLETLSPLEQAVFVLSGCLRDALHGDRQDPALAGNSNSHLPVQGEPLAVGVPRKG